MVIKQYLASLQFNDCWVDLDAPSSWLPMQLVALYCIGWVYWLINILLLDFEIDDTELILRWYIQLLFLLSF